MIDPLNHLTLVHAVAQRRFQWAFGRVAYEDLVQEGMVALCLAARGYDGRTKFVTYAWVSIERAMHRFCDRMGGVVAVPQRSTRQISEKSQEKREQARKRPEDVAYLKTCIDECPSVEEQFERNEAITEVRTAVEQLSPRLREIVQRHWWGDETLPAIANDWGISPERVRQLHVQALGILRGRITNEEPTNDRN